MGVHLAASHSLRNRTDHEDGSCPCLPFATSPQSSMMRARRRPKVVASRWCAVSKYASRSTGADGIVALDVLVSSIPLRSSLCCTPCMKDLIVMGGGGLLLFSWTVLLDFYSCVPSLMG